MGSVDEGKPMTLPPLGFIAVECFFTRPPGDPWNEKTWPFPLVREMATGSTASQLVVGRKYDDAFIDRFVEAGMKLAEKGCIGIITSCGFLAMAQPLLAARLPIPIATSSLIQLPAILAFLPPEKEIGIVTFDASQLVNTHFAQLGVPESAFNRIHIAGAPAGGELQPLVRTGTEYKHAKLEAELVNETINLVKIHPDIGAIIFECTQMPPFAQAIQEALGGIPVYDVFTMARWFYSGLVRQRPDEWGPIP